MLNLEKAQREADRLRQRNMGLLITQISLNWFVKTKDKFFLDSAKKIAQDHKTLNEIYGK